MLFVQLLVNGIFAGSIYALLGLSFATIFSTTKIWHFAQGAVYTLGAYVILAASLYGKLPFALAAGLGVVAAAVLGTLSIAALYRPLQRRGASSLVMVMGSSMLRLDSRITKPVINLVMEAMGRIALSFLLRRTS